MWVDLRRRSGALGRGLRVASGLCRSDRPLSWEGPLHFSLGFGRRNTGSPSQEDDCHVCVWGGVLEGAYGAGKRVSQRAQPSGFFGLNYCGTL